jgi:4-amino-4-deoxy-L-arabinose transferase-like glycosyltransferase
MLDTGNWILPVNNGGEMAYKPPFFHWCIAACSLPTGVVSEYTSRLPSAIALLLMVWGGYFFYARRTRPSFSMVVALITLTNFEVHRAGMNCRVDMVLTAFIVGALYQLFNWRERCGRGLPWLAILMMSGAALTKGPVGIILPCMVTGVYMWMRGTGFVKMVAQMVLLGILSCVLPALWYVAAWRQGGDAFLSLVMEENLGRFLGKMSYESHVNPAYYNVFTLLSGYAPYTLLVVMSLVAIPWKRLSVKPREWWRRLLEMEDYRLFSLLSAVLIFVFYCIPKSKRSVYLLPIYPFIAYFLAEYIVRGVARFHRFRKVIRAYGYVLSAVGLLLAVAFVAVKCGWVPEGLFQGKHAADHIAMLQALAATPFSVGRVLLWILLLLAIYGFFAIRRKKPENPLHIFSVLSLTLSLFMVLDGVIQPPVLNAKSDKPLAVELGERIPEGPVYSYVSTEMMHFFTINFYLNNRVLNFEDEEPKEGYLLVGRNDFELLSEQYKDRYRFTEEWATGKRSCDTRDEVMLYAFKEVN